MIISYILLPQSSVQIKLLCTELSLWFACPLPVVISDMQNILLIISLGFAMGICNIYLAVIPTELSAVVLIMTYWTDLSPAVFVTIFGIVIVVINSYNVRWYGEIEFCFVS